MPRFVPISDYHAVEVQGQPRKALPKEAFDKFNPAVLGLGDISARATSTDAIASVFDLQGFTNFCKQIEPHLSVPKYLNSFLGWLMQGLRNEMRHADVEADVTLYSDLPFFVKYLGDGLLVLWDCAEMSEAAQRNVIVSMFELCRKYKSEFLPTLKTTMVEPPPVLRC